MDSEDYGEGVEQRPNDERTLLDLGEDRLVSDVVQQHLGAPPTPELQVGLGDDAAILRISAAAPDIVVTIDPCPTPVVDLLGVGNRYDWGRLAGVISLSDLAAMGSRPVGLLCSTTMPGDMAVAEYEDFLRGLSDVCAESGAPIIGGNVRDGGEFSATTTALGACSRDSAFTRDGAGVGDELVVVGRAGVFWSAVLSLMSDQNLELLSDLEREALFRPRARSAEAAVLSGRTEIRAALDCSDGLGGAVKTLCEASGVGAVVDFRSFPIEPCVSSVATSASVPLEGLLLAWGDWQLLLAVEGGTAEDLVALLVAEGFDAFVAGQATPRGEGLGYIPATGPTSALRLRDVMDSKRFEATSYLSNGLEGYVQRLRSF